MAAAVKQLQDEMPQFITFGMSHYYSEPKRVRFQSEGGKFIDADAIATAFAETTVLQDECKIHHLMGDIEDNREHRDPTTTPAVPIDELVQITQEKLADTTDEADRRAWLFALFDQLDDIDEATKHNLEPLANALHTALHIDGNNASAVTDSDIRTHIIAMIVDLLFPASESDESDNASPTSRALMLDSTTVSLDYMPAIEILRNHGLTMPAKQTKGLRISLPTFAARRITSPAYPALSTANQHAPWHARCSGR